MNTLNPADLISVFQNSRRAFSRMSCCAAFKYFLAIGLVSGAALPTFAAVTQPTYTATEVGKTVATFAAASTGEHPTICEYQHGQMYIASGSSPSIIQDSFWNMDNPRTPVLIQTLA